MSLNCSRQISMSAKVSPRCFMKRDHCLIVCVRSKSNALDHVMCQGKS